jgi:protein-S-isoprenylcysteine O-methyltransferase Ste14
MVEQNEASSPLPWPPIIYGLAALVATLLTYAVPFALSDSLPAFAARGPRATAGAVFIAAGAALLLGAAGLFKKAGTPIPPNQPTTAIVTAGLYRYTRNPMYLGMTAIMLGLSLATDSVWFLVTLLGALIAVTKLAIEREEAYLERKFGADYLSYKARVRRWL